MEEKRKKEPVLDEEYFPELGAEEDDKEKAKGKSQNKKEPKNLLAKSTKETASTAFQGRNDNAEERKPLFKSNKQVNNVLTGAPLKNPEPVVEEKKPEEKKPFPDDYGMGLSRSNLKKPDENQRREEKPERKERENAFPEGYGDGLVRNPNRVLEKPVNPKEEEFQKALNFNKKSFINKNDKTSLLFQVPFIIDN